MLPEQHSELREQIQAEFAPPRAGGLQLPRHSSARVGTLMLHLAAPWGLGILRVSVWAIAPDGDCTRELRGGVVTSVRGCVATAAWRPFVGGRFCLAAHWNFRCLQQRYRNR